MQHTEDFFQFLFAYTVIISETRIVDPCPQWIVFDFLIKPECIFRHRQICRFHYNVKRWMQCQNLLFQNLQPVFTAGSQNQVAPPSRKRLCRFITNT